MSIPAPQGVDARYLNQEIPRLFDSGFGELNENITALFQAVLQGFIPLEEAEGYVNELTGISDEIRGDLLSRVREVARDNDRYMGTAFRFFGNAWATINMLPNEVELVRVGEELREYVVTEIPLTKVAAADGFSPSLEAPAVQPTIYPILNAAAGAGFPNVVVDEDGVRRRIDLVSRYKDNYYGQLVFAPLLRRLGNPEVELHPDRIILDSGAERRIIPLDNSGRMIINWPPKSFEESFRHLSYNELVVHDRLEEQVRYNLGIMEQAGYLDFHDSDAPVMDLLSYATELKGELLETAENTNPDAAGLEEYREIRRLFFDTLLSLVEGETQATILAEIDRILNSPDLLEEERPEYESIRQEVVTSFAALKADADRLLEIRADLAQTVNKAFIIIGHTGISTTDIGVNPFEKEYMNVGTHAAVANTILQGDFLDELPASVSFVSALVLTLLLAFAIRSLAPLTSLVVGLLFIFGTFAAGIALFLLNGWYLPMLPPILMLSLTFLSVSAIKFMRSEGEKSFLRNAFGHYLSVDVIKQLIDDPDRLNLGGEKKNLTAIFTDIKGFSTVSEKLDPTDLVKLLNQYLTAMSNTILGLKGTIDKYEGDAIIAFFGAPVEFDDHAYRACISAVEMKRIEHELNRMFEEQGLSPSPLLTRVGINTGEMVVGNMGTLQKMDYTVMGNAVNLAARLEGVNKQYGTWILLSEQTRNAAGETFTVRQLDRVRVVGIQQPVRLFELIEEKDRTSSTTFEALDTFHTALELFETQEWPKAEKLFRSVKKILPNDGPSNFFLNRINKFKTSPPADNWDGVFNLTLK